MRRARKFNDVKRTQKENSARHLIAIEKRVEMKTVAVAHYGTTLLLSEARYKAQRHYNLASSFSILVPF